MKYDDSTRFDESCIFDQDLIFNKNTLFEYKTPINLHKNQVSIFQTLEKKINYSNAIRFKTLVNFQQSPNTPLQRWFPYREGYATELVSTFLKEMNIKGNVFDPFSGCGTTLLSARNAGLQSYGDHLL